MKEPPIHITEITCRWDLVSQQNGKKKLKWQRCGRRKKWSRPFGSGSKSNVLHITLKKNLIKVVRLLVTRLSHYSVKGHINVS